MKPCPECEDGSCPCGAGCPACQFTGQCSECHGTTRATVRPKYTNTRASRVRLIEECS